MQNCHKRQSGSASPSLCATTRAGGARSALACSCTFLALTHVTPKNRNPPHPLHASSTPPDTVLVWRAMSLARASRCVSKSCTTLHCRYSKDERGTWIRTVVTSAALVPEEDVGTSEPCAFGVGASRGGRTGSVPYSPLPTTANGSGAAHVSVSGGAAAGGGGGAKDAQVVLVHKYCVTCHIWRPVRGHHCSECGHCMVSAGYLFHRVPMGVGAQG